MYSRSFYVCAHTPSNNSHARRLTRFLALIFLPSSSAYLLPTFQLITPGHPDAEIYRRRLEEGRRLVERMNAHSVSSSASSFIGFSVDALSGLPALSSSKFILTLTSGRPIMHETAVSIHENTSQSASVCSTHEPNRPSFFRDARLVVSPC